MAEETVFADTSESTRMQLATATIFSPGLRSYLLYSPLPATLQTYKSMGTDPVIGLAMDYIIASIVSAGETIESDPDAPEEIKNFIEHQWDVIKPKLMSLALRDVYRYGWSSFEKVWYIDAKGYAIIKPKQLEAQITGLMVDPQTGHLNGVVQPLVLGTANSPSIGFPVQMDMEHACVFSWQPEGSQWYGTSTFERVRAAYNDYLESNEGAKRYDKYISGAHWIVYYPDGVNVTLDGTSVTSAAAAASLLESLESSGAITIPVPVQTVMGQLADQTNGGWDVQIISDTTPRQPSFADRLRFLDVQKVRGLGLTERSMFESSSGTRADAGTHTDVVLSILEWRHNWLITEVNAQIINPLVEQNYGPEYMDMVRVVPVQIQKDSIQAAAEIYKLLMQADPEEAKAIDKPALRSMLQIPSADQTNDGETEQAGTADPEITQKSQDYATVTGVISVNGNGVA